MIKDFSELYDLDISDKVSKKPTFKYNKSTGKMEETGKTLDYINWADMVELLHNNGAISVGFGNYYNPADGHSVFLSCNNLPEVHVWVEIDGDRREITYPVIDGAKDISMEKIVQSDISNASTRAFVKCVSVNWGLGLKLWQKEEKEKPQEPIAEDTQSIFERLKYKANAAAKKVGGASELSGIVGMSENGIKKLLAQCQQISEFEAALDGVL